MAEDIASSVVMVTLIFIGMSLTLSAFVSTGPNTDVSLGLMGWLELHRHQFAWSVGGFHLDRLVVDILTAVLLTGLLAKALRSRKAQSGGRGFLAPASHTTGHAGPHPAVPDSPEG